MQKLVPILLKIIGILLILVGFVAAYYGPLEIFVFYLFSEGGSLYYEGFGMGSFWFAALVLQNIGYYIIAALFLPLGIGHMKLRRWALTLTQLYLVFWLAAGVLLFINFIFLVPALFKYERDENMLLLQILSVAMFLLVVLVFLPGLGIRFYGSDGVKSVFVEHDPNTYWTERYPFSILALLLLFIIMIIILHLAIFFQCIFPIFGQIMFGRPSMYLIAFCVVMQGILIYGTMRLEKWAWWGAVIYVVLLIISSAISFSRYNFYDIVQMMNLPAYEMGFLNKMAVIHETHITGLVVIPLAIVLGLLVYSKQYFYKAKSQEK